MSIHLVQMRYKTGIGFSKNERADKFYYSFKPEDSEL